MIKKLLPKLMVVITGLLLHFNLLAQTPPITLHVETAGTLPTLINESEKYEITDLTLTGNLNGTDIRFIREMAGRDYQGKIINGKLSTLDISKAIIISGGDSYCYDYFTSNNVIGVSMFYNCSNLTNIKLSNSVTLIEGYAFYGCTGLIEITIPYNTASIGEYAFYECKGLTSIIIPNSITSIEEATFEGCTGLMSIVIPDNVTSIGSFAFRGCTKLTSVNIPNNVTSIGYSALKNCTSLTSITIPNKLTEIKYATFENCYRLNEIHCNNPIPPSLGDECFLGVYKAACTLYVPKGSSSLYKTKIGWKDFRNIIEENGMAINTIKRDNITIQSISNGIFIETKEQMPVSVYNLSGQIVYQSVINGNAEISLNKGIYILKVNNESEKVIVK